MMLNHWSDVLGNEVSAGEAVAIATIETQQPEPNALAIADWMREQAQDLHGADFTEQDWSALARQLLKEAQQEAA